MVETERRHKGVNDDVTKDIYLRLAREFAADKKEPVVWLESRAKSLAAEGHWEAVKAYLEIARELDVTGKDKRSRVDILKERNRILAEALEQFSKQQERLSIRYMKLPKPPAGPAADLVDEAERATILSEHLREDMVDYFDADPARLPSM